MVEGSKGGGGQVNHIIIMSTPQPLLAPSQALLLLLPTGHAPWLVDQAFEANIDAAHTQQESNNY